MAQYIDKSALVAEIERRRNQEVQWMEKQGYTECHQGLYHQGLQNGYVNILSFIDTLEVKEYREEYDGFLGKELKMVDDEIERLEKLKVKEVDLKKNSLTWKDINLIDHLLFDIKEDYDNGKLDKEKYYKEVLKKFKAQL